MRVILTPYVDAAVETDLTPYLMAEHSLVLSKERERTTFERTVSDVSVTVSNMTGFITSLISQHGKEAEYRLEVFDDGGVRRFFGIVEGRNIVLSYTEKTATLTAFSMEKKFWEIADSVQRKDFTILVSPSILLVTLQTFISSFVNRFADEFLSGFSAGSFATTQIAYQRINSVSIGCYEALPPYYVIGQLLREMMVWYNAELYVNPVDGMLNMRKRVFWSPTIPRDLTDVLLGDSIEKQVLGEDAFDYVYGYAILPEGLPPPVFISRRTAGTGIPGNATYYYYSKLVFPDGSEGTVSDPLIVTLPSSSLLWQVTLRMPSVSYPIDISKRRLYRVNWTVGYPEQSVLVLEVNGTSEATVTDSGQSLSGSLTFTSRFAAAWHRYTPYGGWDLPIFDVLGGANAPRGKVLDVFPEIRFSLFHYGDPYTLADYVPQFVTDFFQASEDLSVIQERYFPFFSPPSEMSFAVKGYDYELDEVVSATQLGARVAIKRTRSDMFKKTSTIDALLLD